MVYIRQIKQDVLLTNFLGGCSLRSVLLLTLCCLLYLSVASDLYAANSREILVIQSGTDDIYSDVAESFEEHLQQRCASRCPQFKLQVVVVNDSPAPLLNKQVTAAETLIVTIGSRAAKFVAAGKPGSPVLNTLIPKQIFNQLKSKANTRNTSAIYIDQPIQRQLRLIREAMPKRKRVGILISDNSRHRKREILRSATKYGLKPHFGVVNDEQKIGSVLTKLMEKSDVLLALADPLIFNRHTVRNILLSSYHQRIPVIGFSAAYVNAGAIASAFSSPEDIGRHMGDLVTSFLVNKKTTLPKPAYPKYYSIKCNKRVANSLQIHLPPVEQLIHSPGRQPE
jgi:ABC-type uncharacterized transport system substrate-binding protein